MIDAIPGPPRPSRRRADQLCRQACGRFCSNRHIAHSYRLRRDDVLFHPPETSRMTPIHDLSAQALSSAYRGRQLSPVEAARAALARIAAWEAKINAMYAVDEAGARAQAAASRAR